MKLKRLHWAISVILFPLMALVGTLLFGNRFAAFAMLPWPLWLAWRFDNQSGTFLMLAVLAYIVVGVIAFLLAGIVAIATFTRI